MSRQSVALKGPTRKIQNVLGTHVFRTGLSQYGDGHSFRKGIQEGHPEAAASYFPEAGREGNHASTVRGRRYPRANMFRQVQERWAGSKKLFLSIFPAPGDLGERRMAACFRPVPNRKNLAQKRPGEYR